MMAISGAGVIIAGFYPENTVPTLHGLGTAIPFVLGNASLIILAFSFEMPTPLRLYTFLSGVIALLGLVVYASGHYLGLEEGGIERVVAYPQTVCLAVIGFYLVTRSAAPRTRTIKPLYLALYGPKGSVRYSGHPVVVVFRLRRPLTGPHPSRASREQWRNWLEARAPG